MGGHGRGYDMDALGRHRKRDPVQHHAGRHDHGVRVTEEQRVGGVQRGVAVRARAQAPAHAGCGRCRPQARAGRVQAAGVEPQADPQRPHRDPVRLGVGVQIGVVRLHEWPAEPVRRQHAQQADRSGRVHVDDVGGELGEPA
jgi:hypothetical protein